MGNRKQEMIYIKSLKPISEIIENIKNDGAIIEQYVDDHVSIKYKNMDWYINNKMLYKFGNNKKYEFTRNSLYELNSYTHECLNDNFMYHNSWFNNDFFKDEDFIL